MEAFSSIFTMTEQAVGSRFQGNSPRSPGLDVQLPSSGWSCGPGLLGVGHEVGNDVAVADDSKVKTPVLVDSRLPFVFSLVVLLGVQRRMAQVVLQKCDLLEESSANMGGGVIERLYCARKLIYPHRERLGFLRAARFFSSPFI